ncbi:MAG: type II toxin-antitoxin system VapC family toxin [Polyangiaceae bacterium]|nr:type II toxin-antitoxin system VapC family toxin [Polyangiaceae bacterium]
MLDTDSVSFALRGQGDVAERLLQHAPSELCISAVTMAELHYGAETRRSKKLATLLNTFVRSVAVMPFDASAAAAFGSLAAQLTRSGTPIGHLDAMIAAHALSMNLTLVTNNTKHFSKIPHLRIENWA